MLEKRYLLTPGPVPCPPEVLAVMARPIVHHRSPDFVPAYARVLESLPRVLQTTNDVALFTSSGTGAMESAVANLCSPGDRVVVVSAGNFGERWATLAKAFGLELVHLKYGWGETPSADDVRARLAEVGGARAVFLTQCETSTGVVSDVQAMAAAAREAGALSIVDAISSLAAVPLETDAWGVDVVVAGSQKALMVPPGLALASISPAALEAAKASTSPRFYYDWQRTLAAQAKEPPGAPFTPAHTLVLGLDVALRLIFETGLDVIFDRHRRLGRAARAGVKAMGLELFSPDEDRSAVVTAIRMPEGIDGQAIYRAMRDRGVTGAGGQGELRGKIVRIGHIGYVDVYEVVAALDALEASLADAGAPIERGVAASAALAAYRA
ncbi:MAG: alanine--glyoxylate aminotransferase family protein [Thermoleophilia bacterium]